MKIVERVIRKLLGKRFRFRLLKSHKKEDFFDTGWYHPMPIERNGKESNTHVEFGVRSSYPFIKSNVLPELWEEFIRKYMDHFNLVNGKEPLKNKVVWDIGPAEGLFTYLAILDGAKVVEVVQPKNIFADRFLTFFGCSDLLNKVKLNFGYFPNVTPQLEPDLIICAGVLYHAENIEQFLLRILECGVPIFLETTIDINEGNHFDPKRHNDGYSRNTTLHLSWLKKELRKNSFKVIELEKYNFYCQKKENFAPNRSDRHGTPTIRRWSAILVPISRES